MTQCRISLGSSTGSDASALRTTATRDGDGWILRGERMWITSAAQAGIHLVFAKTEADRGTRGITCFIVERDTPGLLVGREERKMGLRSSGTAAMSFQDCRVADDCRVGEPGCGYSIALEALGAGRVGIAAQSLGIGEAAFREGLRYAGDRGKRLIEFQNTRFVVADTRTDLDAAWLLTLRAAKLLDRGECASMETSMAKVAASAPARLEAPAQIQLGVAMYARCMLARRPGAILLVLLAFGSCTRVDRSGPHSEDSEPAKAVVDRTGQRDSAEAVGNGQVEVALPTASDVEPATEPASWTDGGDPCDEQPLEDAARAAQTCEQDSDCALTELGNCNLGGQACGVLPHHREANLESYHRLQKQYLAQCATRRRCRCARPKVAVCRVGRCEAAG